MGCILSIFDFFFGCCSSNSNNAALHHVIASQRRVCTDKLLLILFIASWCINIALLPITISKGADPRKILYPIDMMGRICGVDDGVQAYPYGALPNPIYYTDWVCLASCNLTNSDDTNTMAYVYPSTPYANYCMPSLSALSSISSTFSSSFTSFSLAVAHAISDLFVCFPVMLSSVFLALFVSFVFIVMMRYFAGVVVWGTIAVVCAGGVMLTYSFARQYQTANTDTTTQTQRDAYKWTAIVSACLTAVFVLLVLAMRKRIQVAIEVIKEAAHALNDMRSLIFFPIFPLFIFLWVCVWWLYLSFYIFSVSSTVVSSAPPYVVSHYQTLNPDDSVQVSRYGTPNANINIVNVTSYSTDTTFRIVAVYHMFHLLWTIEFLIYASFLVIVGAVSAWYFVDRDPESGAKIGLSYTPVLDSLARMVRFHLGTVAFAALLIAIVQMIRMAVAYIQKKIGKKGGCTVRVCLCIAQCCLACLECCLDKINKNALIWVSVWGDPFLSSCTHSFSLIWRNLARVAAINTVSVLIIFLGKISVALLTTGICAAIILNNSSYSANTSSAFFPCLIIFIVSYYMASLFLVVFEAIIDATFFCFLIDVEQNLADGRSMASPLSLQQLVDKYRVFSEEHVADVRMHHHQQQVAPQPQPQPQQAQQGMQVGKADLLGED